MEVRCLPRLATASSGFPHAFGRELRTPDGVLERKITSWDPEIGMVSCGAWVLSQSDSESTPGMISMSQNLPSIGLIEIATRSAARGDPIVAACRTATGW